MDFTTFWYREYMALASGYAPVNSYSVLLSSADSPLVRVLNVKYVLSARSDDLPPPGKATVRRVGGIFIARLDRVQPRSFLVPQAVTARNDAQAAQWLRADPASVFRRALLCPGPTGGVPPTPSPGVPGPSGPEHVTMLRYTPQESSWAVQSGRGGTLVTTDAFYPGWDATLDGRPVPVSRADLAFRAVSVPPGTHTVTYRYRPRSVFYGLRLSLTLLPKVSPQLITGLFHASALRPHRALNLRQRRGGYLVGIVPTQLTGDPQQLRNLQPAHQLLEALLVHVHDPIALIRADQQAHIALLPEPLRPQRLHRAAPRQEQSHARRQTPRLLALYAQLGEALRQRRAEIQLIKQHLRIGRTRHGMQQHVREQRRPGPLDRHTHTRARNDAAHRRRPRRREAARHARQR